MPNFIAFGQNDRITIQAAGYRRTSSANSEDFPHHNGNTALEFYDADNNVVATLQEYQYGNIIREDVLRPNM